MRLRARRNPWKADWDKTVEAAKKEGQIGSLRERRLSKSSSRVQQKISRRSKSSAFLVAARTWRNVSWQSGVRKNIWPISIVNGMTTGYNVFYKAKALDPIPPLLVLPEVTDTSKWWQGKHQYVDPEGQYLLNINGETRIVVGYNTKLVNPAEIKSYWDLLNPKWKGKIVAYDPTLGGAGDAMRFFYSSEESRTGIYQADSHARRTS